MAMLYDLPAEVFAAASSLVWVQHDVLHDRAHDVRRGSSDELIVLHENDIISYT